MYAIRFVSISRNKPRKKETHKHNIKRVQPLFQWHAFCLWSSRILEISNILSFVEWMTMSFIFTNPLIMPLKVQPITSNIANSWWPWLTSLVRITCIKISVYSIYIYNLCNFRFISQWNYMYIVVCMKFDVNHDFNYMFSLRRKWT